MWNICYFELIFRINRIIVLNFISVGRDNLLGIATRYGLDGSGVDSRWGARFSAPFRTGPGAHPAFYTASAPGIKR